MLNTTASVFHTKKFEVWKSYPLECARRKFQVLVPPMFFLNFIWLCWVLAVTRGVFDLLLQCVGSLTAAGGI